MENFEKMVEKNPGDYEEIVKKFYKYFGDLFLAGGGEGHGEIENQISQHLLEDPQNPSSNMYVTHIFFKISRTFSQFS